MQLDKKGKTSIRLHCKTLSVSKENAGNGTGEGEGNLSIEQTQSWIFRGTKTRLLFKFLDDREYWIYHGLRL
ncbi:hypothetical protein [Cytobacillus firmus]|uniref:hypothetical protein n=1 Tax=Cytobacillus firmus TaxID=1399 RepID=UPI001F5496C9|nr:hypothetical protein [Cytobacillus firmus]